MPCEQLVSHVCDIKQAYTQYGGKRPFGVSILYMGWDKQLGFQLYQSDPSGKIDMDTVLPLYFNGNEVRRLESRTEVWIIHF